MTTSVFFMRKSNHLKSFIWKKRRII